MIYIQHSYNIAVHTSTGNSNFETFFGYFPPSPLDVVYGKKGGFKEDLTLVALKVEKTVEKIKQIHLQVKETLNKSQENYKDKHDQHKTQRKFRVGDILWLQINKERLHGPGKNIKDMRYGPFKVLEKVEDNTHILSLLSYMCIYS